LRAIAVAVVLAFAMAVPMAADGPQGATIGPGTVFATRDAASIAALRYAHDHMAQAAGRGGTVHVVEGGYSYGPSVRADMQGTLQLTLRPGDVAWYYAQNFDRLTVSRHHPRVPTESDRSMVRLVDPHHRPLYLLDARMRVVRFDGTSTEFVWPHGTVTLEDVVAQN